MCLAFGTMMKMCVDHLQYPTVGLYQNGIQCAPGVLIAAISINFYYLANLRCNCAHRNILFNPSHFIFRHQED
jgi:hypothetical protein